MKISNRREYLTLFVGDVFFLVLSLFLMLSFRFGEIPNQGLFEAHLAPFSLLFIASVLIFYIAGLYEKHTVILKSRLPHIILRAQAFNSVVAVLFFYFVPYFGISPRTNLFIYLLISFGLIIFWRLSLSPLLFTKHSEPALLISSGKEMKELSEEINKNGNYGLHFVSLIDLELDSSLEIEHKIKEMIHKRDVSIVVIDLEHDKVRAILPSLYGMVYSNVRFVAMYKVYEDVFKRIPFSVLQYNWFLENISTSPKLVYDTLKRIIDIVLSLIGGIASLVLYPFVFAIIRLDDGGPIFITQSRIGQGGKMMKILKFRSMKVNDGGLWPVEGDERITRAGKFLRASRIDELPQFWNVLRGDVSLIGPRPDIVDLGKELSEKIPYYNVRNVIQPGLSGWAQTNQEFPPHTIEETKVRLAYDLYYVKNRSLVLDVRIILKTIRTLLSRTGK